MLPGILMANLSDVAERPEWYRVKPSVDDSTERVFPLSGGVHFRDGELHVSWDLGSQILEPSRVEEFASHCLAELAALAEPFIGELR